MLKPFLTANWRYLAMLNFAVIPHFYFLIFLISNFFQIHLFLPISLLSALCSPVVQWSVVL